MPLDDTYIAVIQSSMQGVNMLTATYWQQTAVSGNDDDMISLAELVESAVVDELIKAQSDTLVYNNIKVRRLSPGITDAEVMGIQTPGELSSNPLPSTCYAWLRYYSEPYVKGTSFGWRIAGLPQDGVTDGKLTTGQISRFSDFIQGITAGPLNSNGNFFQLINSRDSKQGGTAGLPGVNKVTVTTTVRNLIGRQSRPLA